MSFRTIIGAIQEGYIVECKKYAPEVLVGPSIVRALYGVVESEKATAGILATTSSFTKGAKEFQSSVAFRISLQDYIGNQKWLRDTNRPLVKRSSGTTAEGRI
jgi:restriction system protein